MACLVLQIGVIIFAVRFGGVLAKRAGIPSVLGELLAGVILSPYALGGIPLPGFPRGLFPVGMYPPGEGMAVSPELYAFATVASIILLFSSGLETDLSLFLRYSLAGGLIGAGGVAFSFVLGDLLGMALLNASFMDPRCLFLGILSTATSVGITARILSDHRRMDSPEGVTILAAAVFDDVLGIIMLAVVLGISAALGGSAPGDSAGAGLDWGGILVIAGKAFGIWLGCTALALIFSKKIAAFLKLFKHGFDFSILALGIALILAGLFEKQGLAMIIGAYISGLSLSKTDIAAVIQDRLRGLYDFFVPLFFAVMGMMVNLREIFSLPVLIFGTLYTLLAIFAKIAGCGGPALLLGFNHRGALRIGMGMVPRGEVALIIAGIGLTAGILDDRLFAVIILMTLITTLAAPPLLSASLNMPGAGTRKPVKGTGSLTAVWEFHSGEIAALVGDLLLQELKTEGFYVQTLNRESPLTLARKDDISLTIIENESALTIITGEVDMPFIKTAVYEVIVGLHDTIEQLKRSSDPRAMRQELSSLGGPGRFDALSLIDPVCITLKLRGNTKEAIITELVDLLDSRGKLLNRGEVLRDVLQREQTMSTGMEHGVALPHGKTEAVQDICVAVGIKKQGVDFESLDGEKSRLFILVVSPKKTAGPHVQFLAAIAAVLKDEALREQVIAADFREDAALLLKRGG
jgi:fructose-specific phosphotransferase system IIA component